MNFRIGDIRKALRLNVNWFTASVLGVDSLTDEEQEELKANDKLPKKSLDLVERSFVLGRLKSILKRAEFGKISYEELVHEANSIKLSPIEELALQQAKLKAAAHIKRIADDIAADVYSELQKASKDTVSEATVRNIIKDEVQLAILNRKTHQELASSLASRLKTKYKKNWSLIAETELHAAKTQGIAQAILSGVDVYSGVGGPDARVSVIPKPTACEDCKGQYLDPNGNPKIFNLGELIANGTNADSNHSKRQGIHIYWKPVLPPLHPRCRCDLQYIPDGASWNNGRLVLENQDLYKQNISKAIGDSSMSPTVKPKGPPGAAKPAGNPAMPGIDSPQGAASKAVAGGSTGPKTVKPGKAKGGGAAGGMEKDYFSKQDYPERPINAIDETDASWVLPKGQSPKYGQQAAQDDSSERNVSNVSENKSIANPHDTVLKHLKTSKIDSMKRIGEDSEGEAGVTASYKVHLEGNGDALMKPNAYADGGVYEAAGYDGLLGGSGLHSCPFGTFAKREEAYYHLHMLFGMSDHIPPTTTRHEGDAEQSMQAWADGYKNLGTFETGGKDLDFRDAVTLAINNAPADKREHLRQRFEELAVMSVIGNHNDHHLNNIMIKPDYSDVIGIDNSCSFGTGLSGHCNGILKSFSRSNMKVKVPDQVMERFEKTTLSDLQRGLKGHVEDWAIGQTFLRMKYVQYLQQHDGYIDPNKIMDGTYGKGDGTEVYQHGLYWDDAKPEGDDPDSHIWRSETYEKLKSKGLTANQLFESFAKQWIEDSLEGDESSTDYKAAVELSRIGVFMGPGMATNPAAYRSSGKHREYENSIKPGYPPKNIKTASGVITKEAKVIGQHKTGVAAPPESSLFGSVEPSDDGSKPLEMESPSSPVKEVSFDNKLENLLEQAEPERKEHVSKLIDSVFDKLLGSKPADGSEALDSNDLLDPALRPADDKPKTVRKVFKKPIEKSARLFVRLD